MAHFKGVSRVAYSPSVSCASVTFGVNGWDFQESIINLFLESVGTPNIIQRNPADAQMSTKNGDLYLYFQVNSFIIETLTEE